MSKNETCTYSRKPQVDVSRIEEIIRNGPNVDAPSAVPLVMPWLRRVVMRLIRNFFVYQQQVNNELVVALKHLSVGSLRPMDSIGGTADLSDQYSDQLLNSAKIAESTARECEERFGEPAEDVARTLRLLAARLRGLSH